MKEFCLPIRVYVEDTDAGGIVYYVNYLKYMERARTEYLRTLGYDKPAVFEHNLMFVVKSTEVSYERPAVLDDRVVATAHFLKVGRASFLMDQKVLRVAPDFDAGYIDSEGFAGAELLCAAKVKIGCISQESKLPAAIPDTMYAHLKSQI
ncbi:MAG: YbgC/FadM family acyl-CoA thioesterase [bacterium]